VETTPVEHWLKIESGVSPFVTRKTTEWDTDFLFKKPWTISREAEFMLGAGPEWASPRQNGRTSNTFAAELAGDFVFWPARRHRFGWFLSRRMTTASPAGMHNPSALSAGLLITIP
jgi:hypothetical protein